MLKRTSHFFACLLLVLVPLQGFAAANMSICNSMMHAQSHTQKAEVAPCHKHMLGIESDAKSNDTASHQPSCKTSCKTVCATLCASFATMAALPGNIPAAVFYSSSSLISLPNQVYASITQPNLQRPPILFS